MGEVKTSAQNGDYVTLNGDYVTSIYYHPSPLTVDGKKKSRKMPKKSLTSLLGRWYKFVRLSNRLSCCFIFRRVEDA